MKIYSINNLTFTAKVNIRKDVKNKATTNNLPDVAMKNTALYEQIEKYLNNDLTKKQYIEDFVKYYNSFGYKADYNVHEKYYVNNLLTEIDTTENLNKIPDKYLKEKMKELLKVKS